MMVFSICMGGGGADGSGGSPSKSIILKDDFVLFLLVCLLVDNFPSIVLYKNTN